MRSMRNFFSSGIWLILLINHTHAFEFRETDDDAELQSGDLNVYKDLQTILSNFEQFHKRYFIRCFVRKECSPEVKDRIHNTLIDPNSYYRKKLSEVIRNYIVKDAESDRRVFDTILENHEWKVKHHFDCNQTESVQNQIYKLFKRITTVIRRMYKMVILVHEQYYFGKKEKNQFGAYDQVANVRDIVESFKKDIMLIATETRKVLSKSSREIRRCDPDKHIKNTTYDRLTLLLQGYVAGEAALDENHSCSGECNFAETQFYGTKGFNMSLSGFGPLYNCSHVPNLNRIYIDRKNNERMYHHLAYEENRFGRTVAKKVWGKLNDSHGKLTKYKVNQIRPQVYQFFAICEICLCYLDQIFVLHAVRRFSKTPVKASAGSVVTGIRWVIRNRIVYMEIQEGMLSNRTVDPSTVKWKITPETTDSEYLQAELRSLYLDDVIVSADSCVTGVSFDFDYDKIILKVHGSAVDEAGNLIMHSGKWYFPNYSDARAELMLDHPDLSELAPIGIEHEIMSKPGQHFVRFQPTDFVKDAAQTTVPYLDIQEIITDPPTLIGGIGTFYKGMKGFGGFVALKLLSADIISLISEINIDKMCGEIDRNSIPESQTTK